MSVPASRCRAKGSPAAGGRRQPERNSVSSMFAAALYLAGTIGSRIVALGEQVRRQRTPAGGHRASAADIAEVLGGTDYADGEPLEAAPPHLARARIAARVSRAPPSPAATSRAFRFDGEHLVHDDAAGGKMQSRGGAWVRGWPAASGAVSAVAVTLKRQPRAAWP